MPEEINKLEEYKQLSEKLQKQIDELKSERILSGESEAGGIPPKEPVKSEDDIIRERCNKMLEGTGFEI
jgi:hypothetical protein